MKAHELYKLALLGRLPVDRWLPEHIAAAAKFDMGDHDLASKWLIEAGRSLLRCQAARLPAERTIVEFKTHGNPFDRIALLCSQPVGEQEAARILCLPLLRFRGRWRKPVVVNTPACGATELLATSLFHAAIATLNSNGSFAEAMQPNDAVNRNRLRRQRPAIFPYVRVTLPTQHSHSSASPIRAPLIYLD